MVSLRPGLPSAASGRPVTAAAAKRRRPVAGAIPGTLGDIAAPDPGGGQAAGSVLACARAHPSPAPPAAPGSAFCRPCLAWLSEDTDEDPLT